METVFIDRRGTDLAITNGRLRIKNAKQDMDTSLPLGQMRALVICCDCALSAAMLRGLSKHQIALYCFHPADIQASFISVPSTSGNVQRRLQQYALMQDEVFSLRLASLIVRIKCRQQRHYLAKLIALRPDKRTELCRAIGQLPAPPEKGSSIKALMGHEGATARAYFSGIRVMFASGLGFTARNKRPPKDPVNAILSLSYALLYFEAKRAITAAGLDPMLGFLHQTSYGRDSLACDLLELIRTKSDAWVQTLFATQSLRLQHFIYTEDGACYLNKAGRKIYFENLMLVAPQWRATLRRYASHLANWIDSIGQCH